MWGTSDPTRSALFIQAKFKCISFQMSFTADLIYISGGRAISQWYCFSLFATRSRFSVFFPGFSRGSRVFLWLRCKKRNIIPWSIITCAVMTHPTQPLTKNFTCDWAQGCALHLLNRAAVIKIWKEAWQIPCFFLLLLRVQRAQSFTPASVDVGCGFDIPWKWCLDAAGCVSPAVTLAADVKLAGL